MPQYLNDELNRLYQRKADLAKQLKYSKQFFPSDVAELHRIRKRLNEKIKRLPHEQVDKG